MKNANRETGAHWLRSASLGAFILFVLAVQPGVAQRQTSAQLTVTMSVQPSIQLVFQNSANVGQIGYCPLTNANTNNVGLDLGSAWVAGIDNSPCASYSNTGASRYQVGSGYNVMVTSMNSTSKSYTLAAYISTAPPAGVTWSINNNVMSTSSTTLSTNSAYGVVNAQTLTVSVTRKVAAMPLTETITYVATAN